MTLFPAAPSAAFAGRQCLRLLQTKLEQFSLKYMSTSSRISISHSQNFLTPPTKPFVIGVAGGTASGKTTVCEKIMNELGIQNGNGRDRQKILCLAQDSFYRELDLNELKDAKAGIYNFDHPNAIDFPLFMNCINSLIDGTQTKIPTYDFVTNSRRPETELVYPPNVLLIEGILIFHFKELRDLINLKVFVDMDDDIRLARRVARDVTTRGRNLSHVLRQYMGTVKPAHENFCLPTKKYADVIIPGGGDNHVAINLLVQHIQKLFADSSAPSSSSYRQGQRGNRNTNNRVLYK